MGSIVYLAFAIAVLIGSIVCVRVGIRHFRMWKAATEPMDESQCVACQSRDVLEPEPACFRCKACGFTWGSGLTALRTKRLRAELTRMPPQARKARALVELREADAKLLSAETLLQTASQQLVGDLIGAGDLVTKDPFSQTRSESLVKAVGEIGLARLHVVDAEAALGAPITLPSGNAEAHDGLLLADMFLESPLMDLLAHHRATELLDLARKMRSAVGRALQTAADSS